MSAGAPELMAAVHSVKDRAIPCRGWRTTGLGRGCAGNWLQRHASSSVHAWHECCGNLQCEWSVEVLPFVCTLHLHQAAINDVAQATVPDMVRWWFPVLEQEQQNDQQNDKLSYFCSRSVCKCSQERSLCIEIQIAKS